MISTFSRVYSAQPFQLQGHIVTVEVDITNGLQDLNVIRNRARLPDITAVSQEALLQSILKERRVELFTEGGHRWFDLKRTGEAQSVLQPLKPGWQNTQLLIPLPETELILNTNLKPQNPGY